jgi:hypothetical protein
MIRDLLLLDNNAIHRLGSERSREKVARNLRVTGREFWPTGVNVMEALKSRDRATRTRLLQTLGTVAGDCHVLPLPTEALRKTAEAIASDAKTITWAEPRFTYLIREPEEVTDEQAAEVRAHLIEEEERFDAAHQRGRDEILPELIKMGGRDRWPDVGGFLDEVWNSPGHLSTYVERLWEQWGLSSDPPIDKLLSDRAWRLYFEGWGAAVYARLLAHPQPPLVQHSDLTQLIYCGSAKSTVLATDDRGFRQVGNALLRGRHPMIELVPLDVMLE